MSRKLNEKCMITGSLWNNINKKDTHKNKENNTDHIMHCYTLKSVRHVFKYWNGGTRDLCPTHLPYLYFFITNIIILYVCVISYSCGYICPTSESLFSSLKRIKINLISTMRENRLSELVLFDVRPEIIIKPEQVVDMYVLINILGLHVFNY